MVSSYYKAVVAAVSLAGTFLAGLSTDPAISGVLPASATGWLAGAAAVVGGTVLTFLVRNQPTVEEAESAVERARERAGL